MDISSIDEIASRWNKRVFNKRDAKESRSRAEPNARRAIQRLQYYKMQLFKNGERSGWGWVNDPSTWHNDSGSNGGGGSSGGGGPAFYPG